MNNSLDIVRAIVNSLIEINNDVKLSATEQLSIDILDAENNAYKKVLSLLELTKENRK